MATYTITPGLPGSRNPLGDDLWTEKGSQLSVSINPQTIIVRQTFGKNPSYASFDASYESTPERIKMITPQILLHLQSQIHAHKIRTPMPSHPKFIFDTSNLIALMDYVKNGPGTIVDTPKEALEAKTTASNTILIVPAST